MGRLPPSVWASAPAFVVFSLAFAIASSPAQAVPPAGAAVRTPVPQPEWVRHEIIPGDRLGEIAARYGVRVHDLRRWNQLTPGEVLSVGRQLRVRSRFAPPPRQEVTHVVQRGDTWNGVAAAYGVDHVRSLQRWNGSVKALRPGQRLIVWVEREDLPQEVERPALPRIEVATSAESVGAPDRGRIANGLQLPPNDALYTIRNPAHSWASSHTITQLQNAIADFRQRTGFERDVVIADISRERGGRFRPHRSHTSGRDVDIRLPLAVGMRQGLVPWQARMVDWDATWDLIKSFADTGQVRYIFLSRSRQRYLWKAAKRAGATQEELSELVQYPRRAQTAVVRHSRGHVKHMHVRFLCAEHESRCRD